ncbi:carboxypeptidase-like regulatory domain-containing protein [Mucilaginibacter sp. RS28]|uniref:Carboxypeptidase-like regulatory domain-containing protein n=1 Tax=Mucilaginibacter straminoryzae TaxID=2932774 RepID=A0A9X1X4Y6_9SPHI|nr:carboxypeptidase-like regulatory domain-containing protein [Mucilaginibacter straminoryzae]MCJ8211076.1 carboxypeptidase-like regulatory domain-containing protein [Mucilaginibacter straminoryzae]
MLKPGLILFIALSTCKLATAQVFEGTVKDQKTGEPLGYVNVGIIGKSLGTVTDETGRYKLNLTNHATDSLKFSMIGYQPKAFAVKDFVSSTAQNKVVLLEPAIFQLKEVKVKDHKWKEKVLGNTTQSQSVSSGFPSSQLGNEIGIIIRIKAAPTYLKRFNASLSSPSTDTVKLRLNFYSVKNGLPDKLLPEQNIFVVVAKGQDKISVDLDPYNIVVNDDFFVSLENVKRSNTNLKFSASFFSSALIAREASQSAWEKIGVGGVGFNVLVTY